MGMNAVICKPFLLSGIADELERVFRNSTEVYERFGSNTDEILKILILLYTNVVQPILFLNFLTGGFDLLRLWL